jgi:hypothetical protein
MRTLTTSLLVKQDGLVTRRQALEQLTPDEVSARLGRHWPVVLPGVYLTQPGPPNLRQRRRAALLRAGENAMLTDLDALDLHGLPNLPTDPFVRVLIPNEAKRSSRDFLVICRTKRLPRARVVAGLPVAPPDRALADFLLRHPDERDGLAVAAAAVQRGLVKVPALAFEASEGPARGRPRLVRIIKSLETGVRSLPENDVRELIRRSQVLPEPLWNSLLKLPSGQLVSPDALWVDAGLIHETNGRRYHAEGDMFEDMQRRNDAMVAADLVVLHNSPRRIGQESRAVLAEIEACYRRHAGRGLPPGVELVREGPPD